MLLQWRKKIHFKEIVQYWSASKGNKPQKTIGVASEYPGKADSALFAKWVIVSPTLASATDLMEAER